VLGGSPLLCHHHTHLFTNYVSYRPGILNEIIRGKKSWNSAFGTFRNCFLLFFSSSFRNYLNFLTLFLQLVLKEFEGGG